MIHNSFTCCWTSKIKLLLWFTLCRELESKIIVVFCFDEYINLKWKQFFFSDLKFLVDINPILQNHKKFYHVWSCSKFCMNIFSCYFWWNLSLFVDLLNTFLLHSPYQPPFSYSTPALYLKSSLPMTSKAVSLIF